MVCSIIQPKNTFFYFRCGHWKQDCLELDVCCVFGRLGVADLSLVEKKGMSNENSIYSIYLTHLNKTFLDKPGNWMRT